MKKMARDEWELENQDERNLKCDINPYSCFFQTAFELFCALGADNDYITFLLGQPQNTVHRAPPTGYFKRR